MITRAFILMMVVFGSINLPMSIFAKTSSIRQTTSNYTMANNAGCYACRMHEEIKALSLKAIKEQILNKLGLKRAPNMTGRALPRIPPLSKLMDMYGMQSDQPKLLEPNHSFDDTKELITKTENIFIFPQPHPKLRHSKGNLDVLLFKFSDRIIQHRVIRAELSIWILGTKVPNVFADSINSSTIQTEDEENIYGENVFSLNKKHIEGFENYNANDNTDDTIIDDDDDDNDDDEDDEDDGIIDLDDKQSDSDDGYAVIHRDRYSDFYDYAEDNNGDSVNVDDDDDDDDDEEEDEDDDYENHDENNDEYSDKQNDSNGNTNSDKNNDRQANVFRNKHQKNEIYIQGQPRKDYFMNKKKIIEKERVTITLQRVLRNSGRKSVSLLGSPLTSRHLRTVSSQGTWVTIELRRMVTEWFKHPRDNFGVALKISTELSGMEKLQIIETNPNAEHAPYLEVQIQKQDIKRNSRIKRNVGLNCDDTSQETRCCRYKLTVDFEKFGWDWIIAPKKYDANYCSGDCPMAFLTAYPNTHIISLAEPPNNTGPCCAPRKLSEITMLYFDNEYQIVFSRLPGMVVERCGCS